MEATRATADFEELGTAEQLGALYGALAKAQAEFTPITKSRTVTVSMKSGGSYTYDYAPMDELVRATRPWLTKYGLAVLQPLSAGADGTRVRAMLAHELGGRLRTTVDVPGAEDIKTAGGNLTYLRRYAYSALLCLDGGEDLDDQPEAKRGERAAASAPKAAAKTTRAKPATEDAEPTRTIEWWRDQHNALCDRAFEKANIQFGEADECGLHVPLLPMPKFSEKAEQHPGKAYDKVPPGYLRAVIWKAKNFAEQPAPIRLHVSHIVARHEIRKLMEAAEQAAAERALGGQAGAA